MIDPDSHRRVCLDAEGFPTTMGPIREFAQAEMTHEMLGSANAGYNGVSFQLHSS
jgi:hypothetical protein